jgi:hypothetical protein
MKTTLISFLESKKTLWRFSFTRKDKFREALNTLRDYNYYLPNANPPSPEQKRGISNIDEYSNSFNISATELENIISLINVEDVEIKEIQPMEYKVFNQGGYLD